MKLMSTLALCKGFAQCRGHITSNDSFALTQEDTSTDTKFSQIFCLLEGGGSIYDDKGIELGSSFDYNAWDLRSLHGKTYSFKAGPHGATWLCINPIPADKFFNFELKRSGTEFDMIGNDSDQIILCTKGNIFVNDKNLNIFNYARVWTGKSAHVKIPHNSEAIYLTR
jgi:hypothetical protein